jgi:hypothetical protein
MIPTFWKLGPGRPLKGGIGNIDNKIDAGGKNLGCGVQVNEAFEGGQSEGIGGVNGPDVLAGLIPSVGEQRGSFATEGTGGAAKLFPRYAVEDHK